jgi:hypothetical protein
MPSFVEEARSKWSPKGNARMDRRGKNGGSQACRWLDMQAPRETNLSHRPRMRAGTCLLSTVYCRPRTYPCHPDIRLAQAPPHHACPLLDPSRHAKVLPSVCLPRPACAASPCCSSAATSRLTSPTVTRPSLLVPPLLGPSGESSTRQLPDSAAYRFASWKT